MAALNDYQGYGLGLLDQGKMHIAHGEIYNHHLSGYKYVLYNSWNYMELNLKTPEVTEKNDEWLEGNYPYICHFEQFDIMSTIIFGYRKYLQYDPHTCI